MPICRHFPGARKTLSEVGTKGVLGLLLMLLFLSAFDAHRRGETGGIAETDKTAETRP